jgi:hypothetical protein
MRGTWIAVGSVVVACALAPSAYADTVKLGESGDFTYMKSSNSLDGFGEFGNIATCRSGISELGGGAQVSGDDPSVSYVEWTHPAENRGWYGAAWHDTEVLTAKLTTWAICARVNEHDFSSPSRSRNIGPGPGPENISVNCDAGHVTGGGAWIDSRNGGREAWITSTFPIDAKADADDVPDDGWRTNEYLRPDNPFAVIEGGAVCLAGSRPTYEEASRVATGEVEAIDVYCPKKMAVVGGGAKWDGTADQAHLVWSRPVDGPDDGKLPDDGWSVKYDNSAEAGTTLHVYAVCM